MVKVRSIRLVVAILLIMVPIILGIIMSGVTAESNQSPVASFTYSPSVPMPEDTIVFNASTSYDSDGWITQYIWNFGDGNTITTTDSTVTHAYPVDGNYTVELTVIDNNSGIGKATIIVQVSTVVFFRVVYRGSLIPVSDVEVTVYYAKGTAWVKAPTGSSKSEIRYDNMTQPNLANTYAERFRNPGFTASILLSGASNIGFDVHPSDWIVFFKFKWGTFESYWPDNTTRVYNYKDGAIETHDYLCGHQAYWDPSASTYVIRAGDIHGNGVAPTDSHPIIVGVLCPPPPQNYYLTVRTDPIGITTIPGQGSYAQYSNVTLTAPATVNVTSTSSYRFTYWDVDGASRGSGVNPITVYMNANHTATAHYIQQYLVTFSQTGLISDATGTVATVNDSAKTYSGLPYSVWVDVGSSFTYSYASTVTSSSVNKQFRLNSATGPSSPFTVTGAATVTGNYVVQYLVTFAQFGLDSSATGTVVTVSGNAKVYADLPFALWVDSGGSVTYSYNSTVSSSTAGKQFRLTSVTGLASPITVTGPTTVTGNYVVQYRVTFTHSGLDATATGTVVAINTQAKEFADLPFISWVDSGSSVTYSFTDPVLSSTAGKRFKLTSVTGSSSPITVTGPVTVTGNYKTQYQVTFDQSGVGSDFTGIVLTVDSANYGVGGLPVSFWWDSNSGHNFAFASPLTVNPSKHYTWSATSGLSSLRSGSLTATTSGNVIGNYIVQNSVTFDILGATSDFTGTSLVIDGTNYKISDLPVSFMWQIGSNHTFEFKSPLLVAANVKQYLWTSTSGLSSLQSGSITINTFGNIIGNYKTQYYLTLTTSPTDITTPSGAGWYDSGSYASISTLQYVYGGSRYCFINWTTTDMPEITDPTSTSTTVYMDKAKTVNANYVHQYYVTFGQTGVDLGFTGRVVTIDGINYNISGLPVSFWWDDNSSHTFSFSSPLIVNPSRQYTWSSTSGLSALQSDTITISGSGSVTGNYETEIKYQVTFDQTGVGTDFSGTVLIVDGVNYKVTDLPISFWWDSGSGPHAFAYQSPLTVTTDVKQYQWTITSGLSTLRVGSITASASGNVVGNYGTQYYLTMTTDPSSITTPSGTGWYDTGTLATISTNAFIDIIPGSSRYRFNGWSTGDITEIANPMASPTTVFMDRGKTVTANYATQYHVTFGQTGVDSDFTGTVVTTDGMNYGVSGLPVSFWWDKDSTHTFTFQSPLVTTSGNKRYVWTSTSGLSTSKSGSIVVSAEGDITGNYKTQYLLTVLTDPSVLSPQPTRDPPGESGPANSWWYDTSTSVTLTAQQITGYTFDHWDIDGASRGNGVNPVTVTIDTDHTATAYYRLVTQMTVTISPPSATIILGNSVSFTSNVIGGTPAYTYQWYVDSSPAPSATSSAWTFTPATTGIYYVFLKVTDSNGVTVQSDNARIAVVSPPSVGGYTVPLAKGASTSQMAAYVALVSLFGLVLSLKKRKRK